MEKLGYFVLGIWQDIKAFFGRYSPRQWKRFGIVVAVVLAVGVATFLFVNRDSARIQSETRLVNELNALLRERESHFEKPEQFTRVLEIIAGNHYDSEDLEASDGRTIFWNKTDNRFVLVNRSGNVIAPLTLPDNYEGRNLEDGTEYVAMVNSPDDLIWHQPNVLYVLTQDVESLSLSFPLRIDLNDHTADAIAVQHTQSEPTVIENGVVKDIIVIDTPNATFTHSGVAGDIAVAQSAGYTENGAVFGAVTVYSGEVTLGEDAMTLLSVGLVEDQLSQPAVLMVDDADYAGAVELSLSDDEDADIPDITRGFVQAIQTAREAASRLDEPNELLEKYADMLDQHPFATVSYRPKDYAQLDVQTQTDDGVQTTTVSWETGSTVFTVRQYSEMGLDADGKPAETRTASVEREDSGAFTSLATATETGGNPIFTFTDKNDKTTLLARDESGDRTISSGVITGIETHDVVLAAGGIQSPGVTVTFADGTRTTDYPGLVWRSQSPEIATVLNGSIAASSLGEASISVYAGRSQATVRASVQETAASIGSANFVSLAAALEQAEAGDTITLQKDNAEPVTVTRPVTIVCDGYEPGEITCPDSMVASEMLDTYSYNGRVTAKVYGAIGNPDSIVDDSVSGTLSEVLETMMSLDYSYSTLYFELYLAGDYALENDVLLPARVASTTSFVIDGDTTFDLNGHILAQETINTVGGDRPVFRVDSGSLTVTDHTHLGLIEACQTVAEIAPGTSMTIKDTAMIHSVPAAVQLLRNNGALSLQGCTVTAIADGVTSISNTAGSTLELSGNTFQTYDGTATIGGEADVLVHSGTFANTQIDLTSGDIEMENGTIGSVFTADGDIHVKNARIDERLRTERGELEIDDGTFSGSVYGGGGLIIHTGRFKGTVFGYEHFTLESGTFSAPVYCWGETEVFDGAFSNTIYFKVDSVIHGGNFRNIVYMDEEGNDGYTLTIEGGRFPNYLDAYNGNIIIKDGTFTYLRTTNGKMIIEGGAFRNDDFLEYLADGHSYSQETIDDRSYYVVK